MVDHEKDLEDIAAGYIRETFGSDLVEWLGREENERYGTAYKFHVRMLAGEKLKVLKQRFEVVEVLPGDKPHGFKVFVQRIQ